MQYEDRVSVATPEGVEVELTLAGLGSRMSAGLYDSVVLVALLFLQALISFLIFAAVGASDELAGGAAAGLGFFVIIFYGTLFEAFREGQTPGKRRLAIRVVGDRGGPVEFRMAFIRNLMLIVDVFLTVFVAAIVAIARSKRSQRLGDMAAGTLVVQAEAEQADADIKVSLGALGALERARSWDTTAISTEEVEAVRHFLHRRATLQPDARRRLAGRLAERLRPKVVGAEPGLDDEWLLEIVVALKASA